MGSSLYAYYSPQHIVGTQENALHPMVHSEQQAATVPKPENPELHSLNQCLSMGMGERRARKSCPYEDKNWWEKRATPGENYQPQRV
jgi:hypothetical protein